ncbi:MAG: HDOD domain-containing protein [bacterium]|jgi:HD-like signal output (HDOD) protein
MATDRLNLILEGIQNLDPWPPVALKVLQLSRQPEICPSDLIRVIQTDASITALVLKLCNSAFYGFQQRIASLPEAGNLLGVEALSNLVLTTCVHGACSGSGSRGSARGRRLWERSVMNALAASLLAGIDGQVSRDRAYTAGLLQNIGHTLIHHHCADFLVEINALRREGADQLCAEKDVLGLNHAEIGARLARRWDLPDELVDVILHHHQPDRAQVDPRLVAVAHMGERVTYALALGEGLGALAYSFSDAKLALQGIDHGRFELIENSLMAELQKVQHLVTAA